MCSVKMEVNVQQWDPILCVLADPALQDQDVKFVTHVLQTQ